MAYSGTSDIQRILWRRPDLSAPKISIGTGSSTTYSIGTTDANSINEEACALVNGMMSFRYAIPPYLGTGTTVHPLAIRWNAMLAAAFIIREVIQRTGDGKPDDYATWLESAVGSEWSPYASRDQILMGSNGAMVAYAGGLYPQPLEGHPQSATIFEIKPPGDTDPDITKEGFVIPVGTS